MARRMSQLAVEAMAKTSAFVAEVREQLPERIGADHADAGHINDVALELTRRNSGLCDAYASLLATSDDEAAAQLVTSALDRLQASEPLLFARAPSREQFAALIFATAQNVPGALNDRRDHAWGESDRATCEDRRARAYVLRKRLLDAGLELPPEDAVISKGAAADVRKDTGLVIAQPFGTIGG